MVHVIEEKQIAEEIVRNSLRLMMLEVYAEWCVPCQIYQPVLEAVDKKYKNVDVYKVNIDEASNFATTNQITAVPTLLFYKDGQEVERIVGLSSIDKISTIIDSFNLDE